MLFVETWQKYLAVSSAYAHPRCVPGLTPGVFWILVLITRERASW
jgi:hypothetical protein